MEANKTNQLVLKSVNQLFGYNFFIPSYQRGYRWTYKQVEQLLEDVWEFAKNPPQQERGEESPFYCLQPIVVKIHNKTEWEVIDGQQRLTTIFLIVHYFNEMWIGKQKIEEPKILYETRTDSSTFLSSLEIENVEVDVNPEIEEPLFNIRVKSASKPDENIDFYHIANAYKAIHFWAEKNKSLLDANKFQSVFQNDTKVIWYEVEETESNSSIDIFSRLNIGKIPLTNSELIRALFLQKRNFAEEKATLKQVQIASEWDAIEKELQDDAFWFFIYNPDNPIKYENRIEYIFDLMKGRTNDSEYYHTFNKFNKDFGANPQGHKPDIDKIWLDIKRYFLTFEEWFKDYELYHFVGYLIDCIPKTKDKNKYVKNIIERIDELKQKADEKTKICFKEYLKNEIKKQVQCDIDEIEYRNKKVRKILLLFNIQTVLETQKSDMRFPFHKYKSEDWDIEHVCSQTDRTISGETQMSDWANDVLEYFTGTTDILKIKKFTNDLNENDEKLKICKSLIKLKNSEKIGTEKFDTTFKQVQKYFNEGEKIENRDHISNLALLDSTTNRSYGNSFFPIKRKRIIENDSKGIFVPIATKNLFLKYYSRELGEVMYWNSNDSKNYLETMKTTLKPYLTIQEK